MTSSLVVKLAAFVWLTGVPAALVAWILVISGEVDYAFVRRLWLFRTRPAFVGLGIFLIVTVRLLDKAME